MKASVRYCSRSGNTKAIAEAIASEVGVTAASVKDGLDDPVDILFLGGALYAGGLDRALVSFIQKLDNSIVKQAAVFGTTASPSSAAQKIKELLEARGVSVADVSFDCRGKFLFAAKGRPNEEDKAAAKAFAQQLLG